jgi:hypothetical protein
MLTLPFLTPIPFAHFKKVENTGYSRLERPRKSQVIRQKPFRHF